jgi:hypothetical protein
MKTGKSTKPIPSEKLAWLADQICTSFPKDATGLKFYVMDCECIYYQRVSRNGDLDPQVGTYRDAEDGPCDVCMDMNEDWGDRVIDEVIVYNSKFQVEL